MNLADYRFKHLGERCYILGNGPSLNAVNLRELNGVTFGTNRIYLSGFTPTYYVACNPLVIEQFKQEIDALNCVKFISGENMATQWENPGFFLPDQSLWEGGTVTYVCLQLAYCMGFEEVILLGMDHDYGEVREPNKQLVAYGADPYHFDPLYFSNGAKWNAPDLATSEFAYAMAKNAFENDERRIINCSARTKLNVFETLPLDHVLAEWKPRVSAIVSAYYAEKFVWDCIKNLKEQTEQAEIIVVCQEGSEEYKEVGHFTGIKVITTPDIPNLATAWNLGVKAATGKYLTNANSDDLRKPDALRLMADSLDARPDIDLVYADSIVIEEGEDDKYFKWIDYDLDALRRSCFVGPQPMWRANLHQRFGMFDETFTVACDYDFWLRCAGESNFLHIPLFLGTFRWHNDNLETRYQDLVVEENRRILSRYHEHVEIAPPQVFFAIMNERARLDVAAIALDAVTQRAGQLGYIQIHIPYMHVHWARDEAVKGFLLNSTSPNDVLVMLDNDHQHPRTIVESLANAPSEFGVVGALAFCRGKQPRPAYYNFDVDGKTALAEVNIPEHGLAPKDVVGTAAMAIKRWVFDKIHEQQPDKPPFFRIMYDQERGGEDWYFANLCRECGVQEYVFYDVETPHIDFQLLTRKTWAEWCEANKERIWEDTFGEAIYETEEAQV